MGADDGTTPPTPLQVRFQTEPSRPLNNNNNNGNVKGDYSLHAKIDDEKDATTTAARSSKQSTIHDDSAAQHLLSDDEDETMANEGGRQSDQMTPPSDVADGLWTTQSTRGNETFRAFITRQRHNIVHFFVEDWFLSAMLGIITAILSISVDVAIEYMIHYRSEFYTYAFAHGFGLIFWVSWLAVFVMMAALFCHAVSPHAVGSGIPEVKVLIHGFAMKGYLSLRTLVAKIVGLTLTLGSGLPVGKEGPFVHMGAIVASLLNTATTSCQYNAFFSNEGRRIEMLSSGCAVGIACTFSAPAGGVLYGIESTSKYFAVKNYWRAFFATTCSALIFRFAMNFIVPPHIAGTITAYYQTNFPNEVFLVEEIPIFILLGVLCGLTGAAFIILHRQIAKSRASNRLYRAIFGRSPVFFTVFMAVVVAFVTYPNGAGQFIAGQLTFRETLVDFLKNCTFAAPFNSSRSCPPEMMEHWTGGPHGGLSTTITLLLYIFVTFNLVAICVSLYVPAGIFVPSFVIGAAMGRLVGELMAVMYPDGIRGPDYPQIWPGLYAVVGAAAYTGAVTHSLSIAVIVCETTGQLCGLLPVLIALMIANALCSFLQPSIYDSIVAIKNYPYLADLPPSRISVHTMRVEQIMIRDLVYISKSTTYGELRELLLDTPQLRSYPFVTDANEMTLIGSVSRRYLVHQLTKLFGPDSQLLVKSRGSRTASELFHTLRRPSTSPALAIPSVLNAASSAGGNHEGLAVSAPPHLTDRQISGNTLLAHSPLHEDQGQNTMLTNLLYSQTTDDISPPGSMARRVDLLRAPLFLHDVAVDPAPFQLVKGTSLYKVHTLFSLLGLNHAYVTHNGRLVGVVALKELRSALENIYSRGAVVPRRRSSVRLSTTVPPHRAAFQGEMSPEIVVSPPPQPGSSSSSR